MDPPPDLPESAHRAVALFRRIEQVTQFQFPPETEAQFKALHEAVTASPRLPLLERLTPDSLRQFTEATLDNVQEGLAATYYHLLNIERIENDVGALVRSTLGEIDIQKGSGVGGGNTRKISFEYEAFVLAIRRTLEYFAASVAIFFEVDCKKIHQVCAKIRGKDPVDLADRIVKRVEAGKAQLSDVLEPDAGISPRNTISHYRHMRAGTLNVSRLGDRYSFGFFSDSDPLGPWDLPTSAKTAIRQEGKHVISLVAPPLREQVRTVEEMIFGVYKDMGLLR